MPAELLAQIPPLTSRRHARAPLPLPWILSFVVALLAVVAVSSMTHLTIDDSLDASEDLTSSMDIIERAQVLMSGYKDAETGQRGYLLTGDEGFLEPFTTSRAAEPARLARLRELLAGNRRQLERLDLINNLAVERNQQLQSTIDLKRQGQWNFAADGARLNAGKVTMDRMRQTMQNLVNDEQARLAQRQQVWRQNNGRAVWASMAGGSVLLALLLGVSLLSVREHRRREDELWVRRTCNLLAKGLQGDLSEASLAHKALAVMAHALRAQAATLYVQEPDRSLRLAGFVGTTAADLPQQLAVGDGWLGEVARDGVTLQLSDVPADHLQVRTAQLAAPVREALIVAVRHEGQPLGVLELGFFSDSGAVARDLAERVAELLGSALASSQRRSQLEQLLEETQRQAEELQAQQEELRVSNEELEERGRVLRESQAELESQQAELERVNGSLSQHARSLEQQQQELRSTASALEAASRYKSEFLANMSHELRTPLNSSLILSRLLSDNKGGTLTEEQVRYARAIHDANNDLLALINDILDLSKIEAGHAELRAETVPLADLVQRLRTLFDPQAHSRGLAFEVEHDAALPAALVTDGQRLAQVLKNLLANAMKFTPQGRVTLALRPGPGGGVRFEVRDTGIGIAVDKQQVIFEAFRQADGSTSRRFGGTGLGLSISRELVLRMGGRIDVTSVPGQGSTFAVELPATLPAATELAAPAAVPAALAPQPPRPLPAAAPPRGPGDRRVLLAVEDDSAFADVLRDLVHEAGFDCVVAASGDEALRLAQDLAPAGVLLDVGLPDVSGLSVLERLKRDSRTRHIPVHMVSATERSQPALQMGAIGHVMKPAAREELLQAIERLRARADNGPRRLLIVEDDEQLRRNLQLLLQAPDVAIDTVGTVADAQQALQRASYDCMVTDLALPDASGFELLERMASDPDSAFPPVIVYTGRALSSDDEQRLRRYSRSIIVKGARSPERLLDEVTLFLHSVESRLPGEQQRLLHVARQRDSVLDGRRILLAEDDVRNIFALTSVLEPLGVRLEVARNGQEALDRLQRKADIDLVLMDVMMPVMDGLAAMRRIREQPAHRHLPIIALTAKAMADDRRQCLDAGANDYLPKPIDVDRLVSLCRVWMPK
jgi:CheY-like chemotaxis protein/CHASE3 domain sensor protein